MAASLAASISSSLQSESTMMSGPLYSPFERGQFPVGVRTIELDDDARKRRFLAEFWYPAQSTLAGRDLAAATQDVFEIGGRSYRQAAIRDAAQHSARCPLILFSHASNHHRRGAAFLSTHLASHGYIVAAIDHSEIAAPELAKPQAESPIEKQVRVDAVVASRVPDIRLLLDHASTVAPHVDAARIGIAGHSFGGWTALSAAALDPRLGAVVALAPGGSSQRRPGILPLHLDFGAANHAPTMLLVAEDDVSLPLAGMHEIFERLPGPKLMAILRRADHAHFMDDAAAIHEATRRARWSGELAWLGEETRPFAELCSAETAHRFTRGLALCHFDAVLNGSAAARQLLDGDIVGTLSAQQIETQLRRA